MSFSIISFTENGVSLSRHIADKLQGERVSLYTKCTAVKNSEKISELTFAQEKIGEWVKKQLEEKNTLIFIGACGIAVRAIAPYITDKLNDSPVLVIDERGSFVIPIISGHMGGANELAVDIADRIDATAVITTATDINSRFAVDLFAKKNGLHIVNKDGIAKTSAKVLANKELTMAVEAEHIDKEGLIPEGIRLVAYPPRKFVDILITKENKSDGAGIVLIPKEYILGIGCKKGKEFFKVKEFIQKSIDEIGITKSQIFAISSIDRKKTEPALLEWSKTERIPFITFTVEQLLEVEQRVNCSAFVKKTVGVDNVCERAALRACVLGGQLVYEKHSQDGMTIAIARREWRINFNEK